MRWIRWTGLALAGAVVASGIGIHGAARWSRATARLLERIEAARTHMPDRAYDARELDTLPAPVQRYLRAALADGLPLITAVNLSHQGQFNMAANAESWRPFTSTQRVVTQPPGFVWDARVMAMPGLPVRVHDAYIAGTGLLQASLAGVYTVADMKPSRTLDEGELMRYLAETAWYPTALLPGQNLRWEAVNAQSARATLTNGAVSVSLLFRFGANGLIESVSGQRGRTVGQEIVMTPWEGRWFNYARRQGVLAPQEGEVAWLLPDKRLPYWRARVLTLEYEPRA